MEPISEITTFYAWNGDMDLKEINKQLHSFKKQGINGLILHVRAGLKLSYLEDDFFKAIKYTIKLAKKLNLNIYLYDEDGWPSGFAGGMVAKISKEYYAMPVKILKEKPSDGLILFSYNLNANNQYELAKNGKYLFVCGFPNEHYVDLLNPNVTDSFIRITHEKYKKEVGQYFGNVIKGIFTDEPQLMFPYVYNKYLKEYYYLLYQENIDEKFYKLEDDDLEAKEFRLKYFSAVSTLFNLNFTLKISNWCKENNLMMMGHFPCEDGLCFYKPNMGVMNHYINMQLPGIDFLGRRLTSPILLKQIESIKNQFKKEKVLCEAFAGSGWNTNFNTFRYIWSYNAAFGINVLCSHLSAYSIEGIRKKDYPAFFSYQEPWFNDYNYLTNTFKNLSDFGSFGKPNNDILVLSPLSSIVIEKDYSEKAKIISTDYRNFVSNLLDKQVRFELTDENILAKYGVIESNSLIINNSKYKIIFVPDFEVIYQSTLDFIIQAKEKGLRICFISSKPKYVFKNNKLELLANNVLDNFDLLNNRDKLLDKYFLYISYQRNIRLSSLTTDMLVKDLIINEKIVDDEFHFLIMNKSETDLKTFKMELTKKYAYLSFPNEISFKKLIKKDDFYQVDLLPMETILIKNSDDPLEYEENKKENSIIETLNFKQAKRCNDNVFCLDKASFKYDKQTYSSIIDVNKIQDEIFKCDGDVLYLKYTFKIDDIISNLKLAIEDNDVIDITFNDFSIPKLKSYFIDKAIRLYDLAKNQKIGINTIIIKYLRKNINIEHSHD